MNKKNNFLNNKRNNNRNNNAHNGVQGGRNMNMNNRLLNQWNERLLMQRICDGAMATLLTNAIAVATQSVNTSSNNSSGPIIPISPPTNKSSNAENENEEQKEDEMSLPLEEKQLVVNVDDSKPKEQQQGQEDSNSKKTMSTVIQNKPTLHLPIATNPVAENSLLQTLLASIINNQIISTRKVDKGTQTDRYLSGKSIPNRMGNIYPGVQQQLINNTFLTSNYKFTGLAKTSSVYFTRGVR